MPVSLPQFGRTVSDARRLADKAEVFLIAVRVSRDDHDYFVIDRATFLSQLDARKPDHQMACELSVGASGRVALHIGTWDAILAAEQAGSA